MIVQIIDGAQDGFRFLRWNFDNVKHPDGKAFPILVKKEIHPDTAHIISAEGHSQAVFPTLGRRIGNVSDPLFIQCGNELVGGIQHISSLLLLLIFHYIRIDGADNTVFLFSQNCYICVHVEGQKNMNIM